MSKTEMTNLKFYFVAFPTVVKTLKEELKAHHLSLSL